MLSNYPDYTTEKKPATMSIPNHPEHKNPSQSENVFSFICFIITKITGYFRTLIYSTPKTNRSINTFATNGCLHIPE